MNNQKQVWLFSVSILAMLALSSCSFQENKFPDAALRSQGNLNSFAALNAKIFEPKCVQCHRGAGGSGRVDMSSYSAIMAQRGLVEANSPARSLVFTEIESGSMPENGPPLDAVEVKAVSDWILAGAPDGEFEATTPAPQGPNIPPALPPPAPPIPTGPRYSQVQKRIFDVSCVSCHSGAKPRAKVNLSSFASLMASPKSGLLVAGMADRSLVYTEILRGSMPPRGSVSAADLALLKDWINGGAHND